MTKPALSLIVGDNKRQYPERQWTMLIRNGLRKEIFEQKVKIKYISARTGLCIGTISRMMQGETQYPRHATVIALLKYLNFKLYAEI